MTNPPTPIQKLLEIKEREQKATKGPWNIFGAGHLRDQNYEHLLSYYPEGSAYIVMEEDADFIAHARTDIPFLLSEVSKLRAALEEIADGRYAKDIAKMHTESVVGENQISEKKASDLFHDILWRVEEYEEIARQALSSDPS